MKIMRTILRSVAFTLVLLAFLAAISFPLNEENLRKEIFITLLSIALGVIAITET